MQGIFLANSKEKRQQKQTLELETELQNTQRDVNEMKCWRNPWTLHYL